MVKSEKTGGCAACGSVGGVTKNYYYMDIDHGASPTTNDVVRLVVEDTLDASDAGVLRTIYGLSDGGQKLREAKIVDPCGTPQFWCESWTMDTTYKNRLAQHRTPAAQDVTDNADAAKFLNPTGNSGANDSDTLNGSAGLIECYEYDDVNGEGFPTAMNVKKGSNDNTPHYVWAKDYLENSRPEAPTPRNQRVCLSRLRRGDLEIRSASNQYRICIYLLVGGL